MIDPSGGGPEEWLGTAAKEVIEQQLQEWLKWHLKIWLGQREIAAANWCRDSPTGFADPLEGWLMLGEGQLDDFEREKLE